MPRHGAYTVTDLPDDRVFELECEKCGRYGRYRKQTLLDRYGDMKLPYLIAELAKCPRLGNYNDGCKAQSKTLVGDIGRRR